MAMIRMPTKASSCIAGAPRLTMSGQEAGLTANPSLKLRVFVVLVREERQPNEFPGVGSVFGSIEKWNWVKEDPALPHAPIDWGERYATKLWSRNV